MGLTLAEVIRGALDARVASLRVSMPGEIVSFDAATQTAHVRPALSDVVAVEGGATAARPLQVIPHVPVQFPGGGGFSLTFPVRAGDPCLLVFSDRSIDEWFARGGQVTPEAARQHHLTDAVAILGVRPRPGALPSVDGSAVSLGQDGAQADFVALAAKVDAQLTALANVFSSWTPVAGDGGAALKTLLATLLATWPQSTASAAVKIRG